MNLTSADSKRDRTFWRGMYLISFVIGVVLPLASIIAAGAITEDSLWRYRPAHNFPSESAMLVVFLAWSASTLLSILGTTSAAWIVMSTGEKLALDHSRGYLRSMFLLAFATGGVIPVAAVISVGVTSQTLAAVEGFLLIVAWSGMLSVAIAGLCCAVWLVRTAALRLGIIAGGESNANQLDPRYPPSAAEIR
jgi:cytochrome bd-type quinol oxidase subunit 2